MTTRQSITKNLINTCPWANIHNFGTLYTATVNQYKLEIKKICEASGFWLSAFGFWLSAFVFRLSAFGWPGILMCEVSAWMEKVENFPIWKNRKIFFQTLMNWDICSIGKFSDKLENFPLFPLFRKFRNFIHPGL